jgi:hypothetical protein
VLCCVVLCCVVLCCVVVVVVVVLLCCKLMMVAALALSLCCAATGVRETWESSDGWRLLCSCCLPCRRWCVALHSSNPRALPHL